MKKLMYLYCICLLTLCINANAQESVNKIESGRISKKMPPPFTEKTKQLLDSLFDKRRTCCMSTDPLIDTCAKVTRANCCSNYCGDQICTQKLLCCHRVSEDLFRELIRDSENLRARFRRKFRDVVGSANCTTQCIRLTANGTTYSIASRNNTETSGAEYESFHTVALMRAIYDRGIDWVYLYKGRDLDDGRKVIPFKVEYLDGSTEYYDLSDSEDFPNGIRR